jgi:hypothetical protein
VPGHVGDTAQPPAAERQYPTCCLRSVHSRNTCHARLRRRPASVSDGSGTAAQRRAQRWARARCLVDNVCCSADRLVVQFRRLEGLGEVVAALVARVGDVDVAAPAVRTAGLAHPLARLKRESRRPCKRTGREAATARAGGGKDGAYEWSGRGCVVSAHSRQMSSSHVAQYSLSGSSCAEHTALQCGRSPPNRDAKRLTKAQVMAYRVLFAMVPF